jgi:AraC family transcriptional regulator
LHDRDEFPVAEIHGIGALQSNVVVADSAGLGWHDGYTSYTAESSWQATLTPVPHLCLAYCSGRAATVRRDIEGEHVERATLEPRRFGSVPSGRTATFRLEGNPDIQHVYLRQQMLEEVAVDVFDADPAVVEVVPHLAFADPLLEQLVVALLGLVRHDTALPTDGLYADHLLRMIGIHVLRTQSNLATARVATSAADATAGRLEAARAHIERSLHEPLSLATIASAVGIRAHVLAPAFKARFGVPLHQYVIAQRVERARTLLRDSDRPIAAVAIECGFSSQSHLTTAFRRAVGTTPAAYRTS